MIDFSNLRYDKTEKVDEERGDGCFNKVDKIIATEIFNNGSDFLYYLVNNLAEETSLETLVNERIASDQIYKNILNKNHGVGERPFFREYSSSSSFETYNLFAKMNVQQLELDPNAKTKLNGLKDEILASPIEVRPGDTVYHGTTLGKLNSWQESGLCREFLSTSLSPKVAHWHAEHDAYHKKQNGVIVSFNIQSAQKVLFCDRGDTKQEREILFLPNQKIEITKISEKFSYEIFGPEERYYNAYIIVEANIY